MGAVHRKMFADKHLHEGFSLFCCQEVITEVRSNILDAARIVIEVYII
jgi:hypothetical protein